MNIYEKILNIMKNVQRIQKDDSVQFGKTKYKALSEEKVTTIMRNQMIEHGLIVYPIQQTTERHGQITHVDVVYRMINTENPEEYIDIASCGDGADTQDKGAGKAMTYAFKYMWLRTFAMPTGEDPDKISSDELDAKELEEAKKQKAETVIGEKDAQVLAKMISERQAEQWLEHFGKTELALLTPEEAGTIKQWVRKVQEKKKQAEALKEKVDAEQGKTA